MHSKTLSKKKKISAVQGQPCIHGEFHNSENYQIPVSEEEKKKEKKEEKGGRKKEVYI